MTREEALNNFPKGHESLKEILDYMYKYSDTIRKSLADPWQDISTAPMNTDVLTVIDGKIKVIRCRKEKTGLLRDKGDPLQKYNWTWRLAYESSIALKPTHWMPIPEFKGE